MTARDTNNSTPSLTLPFPKAWGWEVAACQGLQSSENAEVYTHPLYTVGFQAWSEKPEKEALYRAEYWLLHRTGLLKATTKGLFISWLKVAKKSLALLSIHPKGRQSANPDGGIEGTKKKEKIMGFTCILLCVAHSIYMFQMHKCERKKCINVRKKSAGKEAQWFCQRADKVNHV